MPEGFSFIVRLFWCFIADKGNPRGFQFALVPALLSCYHCFCFSGQNWQTFQIKTFRNVWNFQKHSCVVWLTMGKHLRTGQVTRDATFQMFDIWVQHNKENWPFGYSIWFFFFNIKQSLTVYSNQSISHRTNMQKCIMHEKIFKPSVQYIIRRRLFVYIKSTSHFFITLIFNVIISWVKNDGLPPISHQANK